MPDEFPLDEVLDEDEMIGDKVDPETGLPLEKEIGEAEEEEEDDDPAE